jgi:hypothetical protein
VSTDLSRSSAFVEGARPITNDFVAPLRPCQPLPWHSSIVCPSVPVCTQRVTATLHSSQRLGRWSDPFSGGWRRPPRDRKWVSQHAMRRPINEVSLCIVARIGWGEESLEVRPLCLRFINGRGVPIIEQVHDLIDAYEQLRLQFDPLLARHGICG